MVYRGEIGFVRLLFALISGILLSNVYANDTTYSLAGYLVLLFLMISILLLTLYRKKNIYVNSWVSGLTIHLVFILLGYFLSLHSQYRYSKNYFDSGTPEALVLVIRSEPQNTRVLTRFEAEVKSVVNDGKLNPSNGMLLVSIPKSHSVTYAYGDELLVPALHRPLDPPHNPAEFNYRRYLANRAIFKQVYLEPGQVKRIRTGSANSLYAEALHLRNRMISLYDRYLDRESAALMSTLLLGYRASLSKESIAAFTNTGTLHVLSVSGMHVGILALILGFLFLPFRSNTRIRWLYPLLIISAIWFYAVITGLSAPVCRAALMLSCILIGKGLSRRQNSYNLIAISAFFLLLYKPLYLFDVGFQLSYIAVLGLIYLHPKLYAALYVKNYVADKIWSYIALSIAAQVATLPVSLYYFHQFPVYFLPANLFIALPVMLIMLLGILMAIPLDVIRETLARSLDALISFTNSGLAWIETWPYSTVQSIWLSVTELVLSGVLIWLLTRFGVQRKAVWLTTSLICILLLVSSFSYRSIRSQNKKQVVFFSLRKSNPMAVITNQKAIVFTNLEKDDPNIRFAVTPYLDKTVVETRWIRTDQHYETEEMINERNYLSLGSWKLIRYDRQMRYRNFRQTLSVDVVLLTENPYLNLEEIDKNIRYKLLLIDASNTDRSIDKWIRQAERMGIAYYVLKKNDAYIVDLSY